MNIFDNITSYIQEKTKGTEQTLLPSVNIHIQEKNKRTAKIQNARINTEKLLEKLLKNSEKQQLENRRGRQISFIIGILILIASIINIIISLTF